jgi:hypothetical protein
VLPAPEVLVLLCQSLLGLEILNCGCLEEQPLSAGRLFICPVSAICRGAHVIYAVDDQLGDTVAIQIGRDCDQIRCRPIRQHSKRFRNPHSLSVPRFPPELLLCGLVEGRKTFAAVRPL